MKKYMNNIKYLVFLCLVSVGMTSCGDFLEIEPKTQISEDNFWNEKADIDQMVADVYVKLQSGDIISRCIMWGETRSDNIAEGLDCAGQTSIYRTLKENLLSTNAYTSWASFYSVINECNVVMAMAPVVSERDPVYTESDVRATQAEMAAIRSLCYFYLVRAFKDVPYYTYAIQSEDEVTPMRPVDGDSIVRCLIDDLESRVSDALKAYPEDKNREYNSNCNRITQNAIYALLADLCLWDGQYEKTIEYAQKVIDAKYDEYQEKYARSVSMTTGNVVLFRNTNDTYSKGFPLYPCYSGQSYGNNFSAIFGGDQNSFESIFELAFNYDGSNGNNYKSNSTFGSLYGNHYSKDGNDGQGFLAVSENILNDITSSKTGRIYTSQYDVRYYTDVYNPNFTSQQYTTAYPGKYVAVSATVSQTLKNDDLPFGTRLGTQTYDNRNFVFYRLTDVMLLQAQALVELGTEVSEYNEDGSVKSTKLDDNLNRAFYITWAVNRRSIMVNSSTATPPTNAHELTIGNYNTKSSMEELVLAERRRELMFEGKRWFDLLRLCHRDKSTMPIQSRVSAKGSSGGSSTLFTNYESLFWPYNKDEVKNNSALSQKPYYGNDDDEDSYSKTNK